MAKEDRSLLIRNYPLWSSLSTEEYEALDVEDNFKQVKRNDYIYFEAYHHNMVYFIKQGHIRLGHISDDGTVVTKDILKPGDFFGQIGLERNNLDGEFAQAIKSDVSFCSFTTEKFLALLQKRPELSIKYSKLVGLKFRRFQNRLVNIVQKDVRSRLLLFLQELLQESNRAIPVVNSITIPNYLTHEEIAHLIGSSRQTVTTLLNSLQEEGIIRFSRKELQFPDVSVHFPGWGIEKR